MNLSKKNCKFIHGKKVLLSITFFILILAFILSAGCAKTAEHVAVHAAVKVVETYAKNTPQPTPTIDFYKYRSDTYPGTTYNPFTKTCERPQQTQIPITTPTKSIAQRLAETPITPRPTLIPLATPTKSLSQLLQEGQKTPQPTLFIPKTTPTKSLAQLLLQKEQEAIQKEQEAADQKAKTIANAIDYTNPITRDFAAGLVKKTSSGNYNIAQICDIWGAIKPRWTYFDDPAGQDYFSPASRTINLGLKGDCDDYAILNAAVMQSIGGRSRVVTACNSAGCHAYAEVFISYNKADLQSATNYIGKRYGVNTVYYQGQNPNLIGNGYWLNLDWGANNPGGKFFIDDGTYHVYNPDGVHFTVNSGDIIVSRTV